MQLSINSHNSRAAAAIIAGGAIAVIAATANWRVALLALLAATDRTAGSDVRAATKTRACGALKAGGIRVAAITARGTSCRRARAVVRASMGQPRPNVPGYRCVQTGTRMTVCRRGAARITARR